MRKSTAFTALIFMTLFNGSMWKFLHWISSKSVTKYGKYGQKVTNILK